MQGLMETKMYLSHATFDFMSIAFVIYDGRFMLGSQKLNLFLALECEIKPTGGLDVDTAWTFFPLSIFPLFPSTYPLKCVESHPSTKELYVERELVIDSINIACDE